MDFVDSFINGIKKFIKYKFITPLSFLPSPYDEIDVRKWTNIWKREKVRVNNIKSEYWIYTNSKYINFNSIDTKLSDEHSEINVVYFFHANAENALLAINYLWSYIKQTEDNYIWIMIEYPGYGYNYTGKTEIKESDITKISISIKKRIEKICKSKNIFIKKQICIGRSIGTGPAVILSKEENIDKLILFHPFTSIIEVVLGTHRNHEDQTFMDNLNLFDSYNNILHTKAKSILFIHSIDDEIISVRHTRKLFEICVANFLNRDINMWILPCGGHNVDYLKKYPNNMYIDKCKKIINRTTDIKKKKKIIGKKYMTQTSKKISIYDDILEFLLME